MNYRIKKALVWYANMTAQCVKYPWSEGFRVKELKERYEQFQEVIKEENPDFFNMTVNELEDYGFIRFSSKSNLMLIPLYLMDSFKNGTELICIDGTKKIVGKDYIDDDTRMGCIAYGIYPKVLEGLIKETADVPDMEEAEDEN